MGVAFCLSLAAGLPVVRAASELWDLQTPGFLVRVARTLPVGGNLDIPVAFVIGVFTAWILLFLLDGTKRLQAILVTIVLSLVVAPVALSQERLFETVSAEPIWFSVGALIAGAAGIGSNALYDGFARFSRSDLSESLTWLRFPGATGGLLYSLVTVILITGLDYAAYPAATQSRPVVLVAAIVLVITSFVFMRYSYQKRIVTVSPSSTDPHEPYVIGGLARYVEREYNGFTIDGGESDKGKGLARARTSKQFPRLDNVRFENSSVKFGFTVSLLERFDLPRLPSPVAFVIDLLFKKPVVVDADGLRTHDIEGRLPKDVNSDSGTGDRLDLIADFLKRLLIVPLPLFISERAAYRRGSGVNYLDHADLILLIAPTLKDTESVDPSLSDTYRGVWRRYKQRRTGDLAGTDVVFVFTVTKDMSPVEVKEGRDPNTGVTKMELMSRIGIPVILPDRSDGADASANEGGIDISFDDIVVMDRFADDVGFDSGDGDTTPIGLVQRIYRG
jgi:hypothetical protein